MTRMLVVALLLLAAAPAQAQVCWFFEAYLRGDEVVPPTGSQALVDYLSNFSSCSVCPEWTDDPYTITINMWEPLEGGAPFSLDICRGARGTNGPAIHHLELTTIPFQTQIEFDESQCEALRDTLLYVVLRTRSYPEGEVRGQIIPQAPHSVGQATWGTLRGSYR
ncbi:MAG: CHRD domain-containing protein [Candidatus Eisenbacteria bacterium]